MNRLDKNALQLINNPAVARGWPADLITKLDRAAKQKRPRNVRLTKDETALLADHVDSNRGWFNHHGIQIVLQPGKVFRLC